MAIKSNVKRIFKDDSFKAILTENGKLYRNYYWAHSDDQCNVDVTELTVEFGDDEGMVAGHHIKYYLCNDKLYKLDKNKKWGLNFIEQNKNAKLPKMILDKLNIN